MSQNAEKTQIAFVIMPFEAKFDEIYNDIIKPPFEEAGFEVHRSDSSPNHQNILKRITRTQKRLLNT